MQIDLTELATLLKENTAALNANTEAIYKALDIEAQIKPVGRPKKQQPAPAVEPTPEPAVEEQPEAPTEEKPFESQYYESEKEAVEAKRQATENAKPKPSNKVVVLKKTEPPAPQETAEDPGPESEEEQQQEESPAAEEEDGPVGEANEDVIAIRAIIRDTNAKFKTIPDKKAAFTKGFQAMLPKYGVTTTPLLLKSQVKEFRAELEALAH